MRLVFVIAAVWARDVGKAKLAAFGAFTHVG
ncbi:MAG: hypothetical protein ACD_52C00003G0003 [uncultured bacterium]|nr:MAG: hypothetical protein ACD_52C00003G0003 [uncultured bacterium]